MSKETILITGAAGEIGQALLGHLSANGSDTLVTLDLKDIPQELADKTTHITGSVADIDLLAKIEQGYEFTRIYHMAALLSTKAERSPQLAHQVNVGASVALLEMAARQSKHSGRPVQFIFPSSIAVYGMPDLETKAANPCVAEDQFKAPATLYGCNKLSVETLGRYYTRHYGQLEADAPTRIDFRSLRFPGLISADTIPTGGTSDYGPEMLHAAAKGEAYACFVRPDTTIPFMAMPDAIKALLALTEAPTTSLTRTAYNVSSFSLSAEEFRQQVLAAFASADISYAPDTHRQQIVDSWPADTDDGAARNDWGWEPDYDQTRCFEEYLVPKIRERYITV